MLHSLSLCSPSVQYFILMCGNGFFGQFWPVHAVKCEMSWAVSRKLPSSDNSSSKVLNTMNLSCQLCLATKAHSCPVLVKRQTPVGGNLQVIKAPSVCTLTA